MYTYNVKVLTGTYKPPKVDYMAKKVDTEKMFMSEIEFHRNKVEYFWGIFENLERNSSEELSVTIEVNSGLYVPVKI